jgi:flagellar biosynthesis protein FlhB
VSEQESDDKTEQASERRLERAREDGEIPMGRDLVAAAAVLGGVAAAVWLAVPLRDALVSLTREGLSAVANRGVHAGSGAALRVALLGLAVCGAAALAAAIGGLVQTQGGFWPELALPDFKRLSGGRLARLVTLETLTDLGVAALKIAAISAAIWSIWRASFVALGSLQGAPAATLLDASVGWFVPLAKRLSVAMLAIAGVDLAVNRLRFSKRMKMTREETKREQREEEGDPLLRSRRRRRHRELSRGRVALEVPKADALLVNPTHVAVAIRYRKDEGGGPRVTAKGKGKLAEIMRDIARENGIPIVENVTLARLLYKRVRVGREIPAETYRAVAAVLAFVYRLSARRMGGAAA